MSASVKKRVFGSKESSSRKTADDNEDESGSSDTMETSEDEAVGQEVNVDFEAMAPDDSDFYGIKCLLQQLFQKAHINTSALANLILSQNYVGCVIKQAENASDDDSDMEDDGDDSGNVFGVMSVINMTEKKEECLAEVKQWLLGQCKQHQAHQLAEFAGILQDASRQLGLLISERFVNIPAQIAVPMYSSLMEDMDKACKKGMKYKFDDLLMVAKSYRAVDKTKNQSSQEPSCIFTNPEEELLVKESRLSFTFPVGKDSDTATAVGGKWSEDDAEYRAYRTVVVFASEKLDGFIEKLKELLSSNG